MKQSWQEKRTTQPFQRKLKGMIVIFVLHTSTNMVKQKGRTGGSRGSEE